MRIRVEFFTGTTSFLRNPRVRRNSSCTDLHGQLHINYSNSAVCGAYCTWTVSPLVSPLVLTFSSIIKAAGTVNESFELSYQVTTHRVMTLMPLTEILFIKERFWRACSVYCVTGDLHSSVSHRPMIVVIFASISLTFRLREKKMFIPTRNFDFKEMLQFESCLILRCKGHFIFPYLLLVENKNRTRTY